MSKTLIFVGAAVLIALPGLAESDKSWSIAVGVANVDPKSDNGALDDGTELRVDDNFQPTITAEYLFNDNIGLELLAATPFNHDISIPGVGGIGDTKHLPPTLTLQYHFGSADSRFRPFIGAGVNYTIFFDEDTSGPLAGADLNIENSFGLSARAGVTIELTDNYDLRADVRWIDISPDVELNGASVGSVDIDPLVYGVSIVRTF